MFHLTIIQIIFLSLLQGITELFPISSLGHTVLLPALFHWGDLIRNEKFLPLIVALHLGTSIALLFFFWKDWAKVIQALMGSIRDGEIKKDSEGWIGWLILVGCLPAGLLGVFLESPIKKLFATPIIVSVFLIVNGFILFWGERLRRKGKINTQIKFRSIQSLSLKEALFIGSAQAFALIPGISRSGTAMVAGLSRQLSHEDAARYSFLLGTPIITGAALLEVPLLIGQPVQTTLLIVFGMILSGLAAFASTKFLLKYFETQNLLPFAFYCWGIGLLSLLVFLLIK